MPLPKQVEQDIKEIEEYEKQLAAPVDGETPPEPAPEPAIPPVGEPLAVEPVPTPVVVELKQVSEREIDWPHKYRTLEGKYQAEVPRLHGQVKELTTQVATLMQQVEKVKQQPEPKPATPEPAVSAKEIESFGADLIDVQRRIAAEAVAPFQEQIKLRDNRIAKLEEALQKVGGDVTTVTFEQRLAREIPDFSQVNADPKWIAWLDEIDPYTSEPRRAFAEFVYGQGDVAKLRNVVDFYKKSTSQTPVPPKDVERQQRQAELERQVTPTRTTTPSSAVSPANTRVFTEAEMVGLFNKVRVLNVGGKYDEAAKLEAELSEAYMQNRVRG